MNMIQREEIFTHIRTIICDILKNDQLVITESTTSQDVDGWDSLTHMLIISEVEKQFQVRINFRELMKITNVGGLISIIEKKMN